MPERKYQICTRCVMDTSDPDIVFDARGLCNHCILRDDLVDRFIFVESERKRRLEEIVTSIQKAGRNKEHDCIIGLSGGVDSTFLAYKAKELGLRPLAIHLDNGWDSELAVKNIEHIITRLNIDLYTHVIDWEEFKDLQLSFLKASTPDSEIPTDHAINAILMQMAEKIGVRYILLGANIATESHLPKAWSQGHLDWRYIKNVHRQFGTKGLKTFPHMDIWRYARYLLTMASIDILNYLNYNKKEAIEILKKELCWKDYGWKHFESIYTRFYQGYILPKKFGYDKRQTHFSSLICSGEMTREEALDKLREAPYPLKMQMDDRAYIIKKFDLSEETFEQIMSLPKKTYWDYPSYGKMFNGTVYKITRSFYQKYIKK